MSILDLFKNYKKSADDKASMVGDGRHVIKADVLKEEIEKRRADYQRIRREIIKEQSNLISVQK